MSSRAGRKRHMEAAAFDAFYSDVAAALTRQLYLLLGDMPAAQNAVQVAFARAWRTGPRAGSLPELEAWLRGEALRAARSRSRRAVHALRGRRRLPDEALLYAARDVAVVEALARLPAGQRAVLVLRHLVGLDVEEVAAKTGRPAEEVQAELDEGLARLADLLPHLLTPTDDAGIQALLHEAAQRRRPVLLPARDIRGRKWRRGYYISAVAAAVAAVALLTSVAVAKLVLTETYEGAGLAGATPTPTATQPPTPTPTTEPAYPLGSTTARATGIPRNRRDLGYLAGSTRRAGGTFLRFDRALLRSNGTIANANPDLREIPLAPAVEVRGGNKLPAIQTVAELFRLLDAGKLRGVPFVLHYDADDQVDEVRELLHR